MSLSTGRKVLLLTGAAGRLGTELINLIGDKLEIVAFIHRKPLQAATAASEGYDLAEGSRHCAAIRAVVCDLTCEADVRATMRLLTTFVPRIHYVVNCAGDLRFLGSTTDAHALAAEARRQFDLNVHTPALISAILFQEQWKHVPVSQQDASILNVSSLSGSKAFVGSGQGFYAASKAAINMLTLHMAADYGKYGIKVNALCPDGFPSRQKTRDVAEATLKGLLGPATGQLFSV